MRSVTVPELVDIDGRDPRGLERGGQDGGAVGATVARSSRDWSGRTRVDRSRPQSRVRQRRGGDRSGRRSTSWLRRARTQFRAQPTIAVFAPEHTTRWVGSGARWSGPGNRHAGSGTTTTHYVATSPRGRCQYGWVFVRARAQVLASVLVATMGRTRETGQRKRIVPELIGVPRDPRLRPWRRA
jgi:hypothetical protein